MANPLAFLGSRGDRRPDPEPVQIDLVRVCLVGTAVWLVVLVGCGLGWVVTSRPGLGAWATVALAGVGLGLLGVWWARNRGPGARGRK